MVCYAFGGSDPAGEAFQGKLQGRGPVCVVQNTNVIAVGIEPALLVGHESAPLTLPIDAPKDALSELLDDLRQDAIAILPAGRHEPSLRGMHVLQSALACRGRIACVQIELTPLPASALVRLAASVAPEAPSAALLADA